MTAAGYSTLENELKHRQQVERPREMEPSIVYTLEDMK